MEYPGAAVTLTGSAQQLSSTVGMVAKVQLRAHPQNTQPVYWGNASLDPATNTGVMGFLPAPTADNPAPVAVIDQYRAAHAIFTDLLYVSGTANEVLLWSYVAG